MPWLVASLDVCSDGGNGWTVNNQHAAGRLPVSVLGNATDLEILRSLADDLGYGGDGWSIDDDMVMGNGNGGNDLVWEVTYRPENTEDEFEVWDTYRTEQEAHVAAEEFTSVPQGAGMETFVQEAEGDAQDWPVMSIDYVYSPVIDRALELVRQVRQAFTEPTNINADDIERAVLWAFDADDERRELILDHDTRAWWHNTEFDRELGRRRRSKLSTFEVENRPEASAAVAAELTEQLVHEAVRAYKAWKSSGVEFGAVKDDGFGDIGGLAATPSPTSQTFSTIEALGRKFHEMAWVGINRGPNNNEDYPASNNATEARQRVVSMWHAFLKVVDNANESNAVWGYGVRTGFWLPYRAPDALRTSRYGVEFFWFPNARDMGEDLEFHLQEADGTGMWLPIDPPAFGNSFGPLHRISRHLVSQIQRVRDEMPGAEGHEILLMAMGPPSESKDRAMARLKRILEGEPGFDGVGGPNNLAAVQSFTPHGTHYLEPGDIPGWPAEVEAYLITKRSSVVVLGRLFVPKDERGRGLAQAAMRALTAWADANGTTLALSTTDEWGSSEARLAKFYKGFGFKSNKGRTIDHAISETMVRLPQ